MPAASIPLRLSSHQPSIHLPPPLTQLGRKGYEKLQKDGSTHGGEIDTSSRFIHLSDLNQVMSTLNNFFRNVDTDLFLLQIDAQKLGEGLVYESVDGINSFPHFYGSDRSFVHLPLDA
ncbi:hypothetical protein LINPERPRIM_LOCUS1558, partial [Linum perenne]